MEMDLGDDIASEYLSRESEWWKGGGGEEGGRVSEVCHVDMVTRRCPVPPNTTMT